MEFFGHLSCDWRACLPDSAKCLLRESARAAANKDKNIYTVQVDESTIVSSIDKMMADATSQLIPMCKKYFCQLNLDIGFSIIDTVDPSLARSLLEVLRKKIYLN